MNKIEENVVARFVRSSLSVSIGPEITALMKKHPKVRLKDAGVVKSTGVAGDAYHIEFAFIDNDGDPVIYSARLTDNRENAVLRLDRRPSINLIKTGIPKTWSAKRVYDLLTDKLEYMHGEADQVKQAAVDLRQQMHKPAEADDALGQAYVKLVSFKQGIDAMEEIPAYLKPYYRQVTKAMEAVGDARKDTYQLRMMVRKLSF